MKILVLLETAGVEKTTAFLEVMRTLESRSIKVNITISQMDKDYSMDQYYICSKYVSINVLEYSSNSKSFLEKVKNVIRRNHRLEKICSDIIILFDLFYSSVLKFMRHIVNQKDDIETFLNASMRGYLPGEDYSFFWVVDEKGLLWAEHINMNREAKVNVIYHCLELYWEHYLLQTKKDWRHKRIYDLFELAKDIVQKCSLVIIQDQNRWDVLCYYTGIPNSMKHFFLPISIWDYNYKGSNIVKERWNIEGKGFRIIFYPTYLAPKRGCTELTKISRNLPEDYMVVIHGFSAIPGYIRELNSTLSEKSKVLISNVSIEYDELVKLHRDVWCVFLYYDETDNNNKYITNASNKLVTSLQAGKPIITLGNQMLNELCVNYRCGVVINSWSEEEIRLALEKLESNYDVYCRNAKRCYEERFNIELFSESLNTALEEGLT